MTVRESYNTLVALEYVISRTPNSDHQPLRFKITLDYIRRHPQVTLREWRFCSLSEGTSVARTRALLHPGPSRWGFGVQGSDETPQDCMVHIFQMHAHIYAAQNAGRRGNSTLHDYYYYYYSLKSRRVSQ